MAFVERWPYLRGFIAMNADVIGTTVSVLYREGGLVRGGL